MKGQWVKFFPSDFLNGVADLDDGERGAYITILCLIWDRGGPIPDDAGWLARRCGITGRRWAFLRRRLIELGKITIDGDQITNRRAMLELSRREEMAGKRSAAADARWRREDKTKTAENRESRDAIASPVDNSGKTDFSTKNTTFSARKLEENSEFSDTATPVNNLQETAENSHSGDAIGMQVHPVCIDSPSRARARKTLEARDSYSEHHSSYAARAADDDRPNDDLYGLTIACCDAAGMSARIASRPALLTQSIEIVKGWQAAGVDVRKVAVPIIADQLERMAEPAHSLAKFTAMIDTHIAKSKRRKETHGEPLKPPRTAVFEFDDEAPDILTFRKALAAKIGKSIYAQFCEAIRLDRTDFASEGDGDVLLVSARSGAQSFWTPGMVIDRHRSQMQTVAKQTLGASKVWER